MYDQLAGIRVLEIASWVFMPSCGVILADWGADVIKVEDPLRGDPQRGLFQHLSAVDVPNPMIEVTNRGKRSVGIDLKQEASRPILDALLSSADVLLTNYSLPILDRLGLSKERVRSLNPRIVYARGTGYGSRGADATKGGFDSASTWARAGMAHQLADHRGVPPTLPGSFGDLVSGLAAAGGVSAALAKRERTGVGDDLEVSLLASGMWMMCQSITGAPFGIAPLPLNRLDPPNPIANHYQTSDGRWIQLTMLQSDRFWAELCGLLEHPALASDARFQDAAARAENSAACAAALSAIFALRSLSEWKVLLAESRGVWDVLQSPREVSVDAQALDNGYLPSVARDGRADFRVVASPVQFGGAELSGLTPAPEMGQHTEEVLLEFGLSWEEISDLKSAHVIL